jgi:hypothetical protein
MAYASTHLEGHPSLYFVFVTLVLASRSSRVLAPSTMRSPREAQLEHSRTCAQSIANSQCGRISGVVNVPRKLSGSTSSPASHSTTARKTSPPFPLRRCTWTSDAEILPSEPSLLRLLPESLAVVEAVRGRMARGFHAVESDDASKARK